MFDDDDEGFEDFYMPDQEEFRRKMEEEANIKFRAAAYRGYQYLVEHGASAVSYQERDSAILAIRRILGLMESEEEFEKCIFLRKFLKEELKIEEPQPMYDFQKV